MLREKRLRGRPKKETKDKRVISYSVSVSRDEDVIVQRLMKEKSSGSISNLFRMLLNESLKK